MPEGFGSPGNEGQRTCFAFIVVPPCTRHPSLPLLSAVLFRTVILFDLFYVWIYVSFPLALYCHCSGTCHLFFRYAFHFTLVIIHFACNASHTSAFLLIHRRVSHIYASSQSA
jgi:hypothetical protein